MNQITTEQAKKLQALIRVGQAAEKEASAAYNRWSELGILASNARTEIQNYLDELDSLEEVKEETKPVREFYRNSKRV